MLCITSFVIDFSKLPLFYQVHIMQNTDIYISVHDAGLINMIFMKPHSALVEVCVWPAQQTNMVCSTIML
jgi:hypothetical protein